MVNAGEEVKGMQDQEQHVDTRTLKAQYPLSEVARRHGVDLQGNEHLQMGLCPWHHDTDRSLAIYGDDHFWCFACGAGGDVFDFVWSWKQGYISEARENFREAISLLTGLPAPAPQARPGSPKQHREIKRNPELLTSAAVLYHATLNHPEHGMEGMEYLRSRRVFDNAIKSLYLGYCPGEPLVLRQHLQRTGFDEEAIRESFLTLGEDHWQERFNRQIVVPETVDGKVEWLHGRTIDPDTSPRFQSLPGTKPIFGMGRMKEYRGCVILTEGLFDWISLAGWGLPTIATLGAWEASKRESDRRMIQRISEAMGQFRAVILALDNDKAGQDTSHAIQQLLGSNSISFRYPQGDGIPSDIAGFNSPLDPIRNYFWQETRTLWRHLTGEEVTRLSYG